MKQRFQDNIMQNHYEKLIKYGLNWRKADKMTLRAFHEYDEGLR